MLWEDLTAEEFSQAVKESRGTCILPLGVIEKHGSHLPLGTDMFAVRRLAEEVARSEGCVVFPFYFFGQIAEARHCPGTIAIKPQLLYDLLEEVCKEISRNGFKKIVLLNGHGGNIQFLKYFAQSSLYEKKDYGVFVLEPCWDEEMQKKSREILGTEDMGEHAGNMETAWMMECRPDLVKMDRVNPEGARRHGRLDHLGDVFTGIGWYANYPTHQAGDPGLASKEAGRQLFDLLVKKTGEIVRKIKNDERMLAVQDEFFSEC